MAAGTLPLDLVTPLVEAALAEDVGSGDVTSRATVPEGAEGSGSIVAKEAGVVCGLPVARIVFERVDGRLLFEPDVQEGARVAPGDLLARVRGPVRAILTAERTALNFLQHLSGIATATAAAVAALEGTGVRLLDTRKTVPGLRLLAKYAVRTGGGGNHRLGLYDMVMIKENHAAAAGGVAAAIRLARQACPSHVLEVEVTDLKEVVQALAEGPDRILLDNFAPERIREAAALVRAREDPPEIEVSGGVTFDTLRSVAVPGVDFVSMGAITHSAPALDLSLELDPSRRGS